MPLDPPHLSMDARARPTHPCPWRQLTLLENLHVGKSDVWQKWRTANRICGPVENPVIKPALCLEAAQSTVTSRQLLFAFDWR